jgi:hypothetical protein
LKVPRYISFDIILYLQIKRVCRKLNFMIYSVIRCSSHSSSIRYLCRRLLLKTIVEERNLALLGFVKFICLFFPIVLDVDDYLSDSVRLDRIYRKGQEKKRSKEYEKE